MEDTMVGNELFGLGPAIRRHRLLGPLFRALLSKRELLHGASWSVAAAVVARSSNLAALIICARLLPQERFGEVAIIQGTVGMFGPLAGLGLSATTTKFLAEYRTADRLRAGRILALSLAMAAIAGLMMTGALILFAPQLAARGLAAPQLSGSLVAASGLLLFGVFEAVQTGALVGFEAFSRIARLSCWNGLLSIPVIVLLTYLYGSQGALAGLTLSVALSCLLNWIALRAACRRYDVHPTFKGCSSERHVLLSFSLPSYLSGLLVAPATWLTSAYLVNQPGGYSEMALFGAADRFRYLLIFLPLAASRIAIPALSRYRSSGDHDGYRSAFRWNLIFGLLTTVVPALACIALSRFLMSWYGVDFRKGWPVLSILALSAIPTVLNTQLGSALLSNNRAWSRTVADMVLTIVFLSVAWVAIPRWGSVGLAGSFVLAYSAACLMMWISLRKGHAKS
ncbi:MAG: oligosaccharide flippase family protein [Acidobacteriota bacterium]